METGSTCTGVVAGGLTVPVRTGGSPPAAEPAFVDVELIRRMRVMAQDELAEVIELERSPDVVRYVQSLLESKRGFRPEMAERLAGACGDAIAACTRALQADIREIDGLLQMAAEPDGEALLHLNSSSPSGRYMLLGSHYLLDTATARIYPVGVSAWLALSGEVLVDSVAWLDDEARLAFRLTWPCRSVYALFDLRSWKITEVEQGRFESLMAKHQDS